MLKATKRSQTFFRSVSRSELVFGKTTAIPGLRWYYLSSAREGQGKCMCFCLRQSTRYSRVRMPPVRLPLLSDNLRDSFGKKACTQTYLTSSRCKCSASLGIATRECYARTPDSISLISLAQLIPRQVARLGRTIRPCWGLLKNRVLLVMVVVVQMNIPKIMTLNCGETWIYDWSSRLCTQLRQLWN